MQTALKTFADTLQEKFSVHIQGEPEDQLRAPFEQLLKDVGDVLKKDVLSIGETRLANHGGRPDFGISIHKLLCGYAELKAPGKGADTRSFRGHDKKQWKRFSNLPNILYTDGHEFGLYRTGERERWVRLDGDPQHDGAAAVSAENARAFEVLIRDFLNWEPVTPKNARQLAEYLAPLCRILRDDVYDALMADTSGVVAAADDWRRYLFPGADDARFADAYAQTVTFSLLLARSGGSDILSLSEAIESLSSANTLLSGALRILADPLVKKHLSTSLGLLQRVISAVPTGTMSGGRRDPWLHFYEDFLAVYDPKLRKDAGVYYTPVEVVQAQVRIVDEILRTHMNKPMGFATGGVNVLDPAVGTGTYLLGIVEHALERIHEEEGPGSVPARADLLGTTLYGFEFMVGPYAVAALRLTRMLQQYGAHLPGDGVQIMLSNTLESPHYKIPDLPILYRQIGVEHQRAQRVKDSVPVLVCLGNPPYDRHEKATIENRSQTGGWVRWGEAKDGNDAILEDFIEPVKAAGFGGDLKNLYNQYIYFWRWALWKTFEHDLARGPGIVSYITASSFIDGNAFLGMRRWMRRVCDEIWIIDLGGEGRGTRKDDNVFAIQTPVAITITVRYGAPNPDEPAKTHYTRIQGTRAQKLNALEALNSLDNLNFTDCPDLWDAPMRPAGEGRYFNWPLLTELMPWQHSGTQGKRTWPIGSSLQVLHARWNALLTSSDRATAFKESSDRVITKNYRQFGGSTDDITAIAKLSDDTACPKPMPYGYRSFDRQFILADNRLLSRPRASLWQCYSDQQIYFSSLFTQPLDDGPALTASPDVPDLHYFRGSYGAKDIFPLWRDATATQPNLHPELLDLLKETYGQVVKAEEVAAYFYAVLAQPAFTARFRKQLNSRELRVPLTAEHSLFERAVEIGRELLFLHTYGERFKKGQSWPKPYTKCLKSVPHGQLPDEFSYDEDRQIINVGGGEFGSVSKAVWEYDVSGLKVVQSWLDYRMQNTSGKKTSPLDEIRPSAWTSAYTSEFLRLLNLLEQTIAMQPAQEALLDEILSNSLIQADDLGDVPKHARKPAKHAVGQVKIL